MITLKMINMSIIISLFLIKNTYSFPCNKHIKPLYQKSLLYTQKYSKNMNSLDTNLTKFEDCIFNFDCNYDKSDDELSLVNLTHIVRICDRKINYISIGLLLGIITSEFIKIDDIYLTSITFFQNLDILAYYLFPLFLITFFHEINSENQTEIIDYIGKTSIISLLYIFYYEYHNNTTIITESDRTVFNMIKLYIDVLFKLKFDYN